MFDFLRNLTKSAEEKRQEMLAAYLDGALSPAERQQFEQMLAQNPGLQAELEQQQAMKQMLSQIPQRRVPRNFTLDPAQYGRPAKQPLVQYYPALRAATVLTAVMLFFVVGLGIYTQGGPSTSGSAANIAMEPDASDEGAVVLEFETEEEAEAEEMAVEAPAEEAAPAAEVEEAMEEEAMAEDSAAVPAVATATFAPMATSSPSPATGLTTTEDEEGNTDLEAAGEADESEALVEATPTPMATATQSSLPRVDATELADRAVTAEAELAPTLQADFFTATEQPPDEDTAVTSIQEQAEQKSEEPQTGNLFTPLLTALIVLLIVLVLLTLYARRQLL